MYLLCKRNRNGTTIILEVTNGQTCVSIPVKHLSLCPSYWKIQPPVNISDLELIGSCFSRKLKVNWPGFKAKSNSYSKTMNFEIANTIDLSYVKYRSLKRVLNQPFCVFLLVEHNDIGYVLYENGTATGYPSCPDLRSLEDHIQNLDLQDHPILDMQYPKIPNTKLQ